MRYARYSKERKRDPRIRRKPRAQRSLVPDMSYHMDFIGQRADKSVVQDVAGVEEIETGHGVVVNGVVKEIEHYTISCDECGGDGFYDQRGEVICEGCGMVLSGESQPSLPVEYNADATDSVGSSRGLEKMGGHRGSFQPRNG